METGSKPTPESNFEPASESDHLAEVIPMENYRPPDVAREAFIAERQERFLRAARETRRPGYEDRYKALAEQARALAAEEYDAKLNNAQSTESADGGA